MLRVSVCVLFSVVLTAPCTWADGADLPKPDRAQVQRGDQADQAEDSTAARSAKPHKTRRMLPEGWVFLGPVLAVLAFLGVLLGGSWRIRRRDRQATARETAAGAGTVPGLGPRRAGLRARSDGPTMGLYVSETEAASSRQPTRQEHD
jgi:hypothetical protein